MSRTPQLCACGDHAFAAITGGVSVLVSPEDMHLLVLKWHYYQPHKARPYRTVRRRAEGNSTITLAAAIVCPPPGFLADHVNRDTLDNRRHNLRIATYRQNAQNRKTRVRKYDLPKGVLKNGRAFTAVITVNGHRRYLGRFPTPEQAHAAYTAAAERYFGQFARIA